MRFRLRWLHPPLDRALHERLVAAGHTPARHDVDALVVGTGEPRRSTPVLEMDAEDWSDVVQRARDAFMAARDVAADLLGRGAPGSIVFVVDPPALRVLAGGASLAVPGALVATAAQVAAVELAPHGVAVNTVVAGWMEPAPAALRPPVAPEAVAAACEFLLAQRSAAVTGATLAADGGWHVTKATGPSPLLGG